MARMAANCTRIEPNPSRMTRNLRADCSEGLTSVTARYSTRPWSPNAEFNPSSYCCRGSPSEANPSSAAAKPPRTTRSRMMRPRLTGHIRLVRSCQRIAAQRLQQHAVQPQLARIAEAVGAQRHTRMPHGRLGGAAMHFRGYDDAAEHAVEIGRQAHIAMVERRRGIQHDVERQHGDRWRAERYNRRELDHHGDAHALARAAIAEYSSFDCASRSPAMTPGSRSAWNNGAAQAYIWTYRWPEWSGPTRDRPNPQLRLG